MISNPLRPEEHNRQVVWPVVSLLDVVPTIMDWHKVPLPSYAILKKSISFTGRSLLSVPSNFPLVTRIFFLKKRSYKNTYESLGNSEETIK